MIGTHSPEFARGNRDRAEASIRLTVLLTHPIQYYAPWFRFITERCPEIVLTVLYLTEPDSRQQAVGFGNSFVWDVPLREGYANHVVRPSKPGESVHSESFLGLDVPEAVTALVEGKPDVVMIPGWHSVTFLRALRECRRRGIPVLYRGDSNLKSGRGGLRGLIRSLRTRFLLGRYDAYLSVGQRSREYLLHHGVPPERIFASPHCVDNDFFQQATETERRKNPRLARPEAGEIGVGALQVLFVGKLEAKKRLSDLIAATASTRARIHLIVVGSGELRESLEGLARAVGANVTWLGFLNQSQIGRAYAGADCLVLPSDGRETWGLVVNEAMASGIPCVVSDAVGCAPDLIVPGTTGEVFEVANPTALAAALDRVKVRRDSGGMTADDCRSHVAKYSFAQATAGLLSACRFVLHENSVRAQRGKTRRG